MPEHHDENEHMPMTRRERVVAVLVGRALVWLGKCAHDRGDRVEYENALAALKAGSGMR